MVNVDLYSALSWTHL